MAGRLFGTFLIIIFLTYMVLLSSFYFMHQSVVMNVNSLNYNVCETLSTSGVFTPQLYEYLTDTLNKYGNYLIKVKLEKELKAGVYDTYFYSDGDIKNEIKPNALPGSNYFYLVNRKLSIGDRVTIYIEDRDSTLFGRLINASFMGSGGDRVVDTKIKSLKSCVIANEARDFVKGYDVIADIKNRLATVEILVQTKLSSGQYPYNSINPVYGDELNEQAANGNPKLDFISENGEFLRKYIYLSDGITIEKIVYIQQ